jgi:hypothetical protein
MRPSPPPELGGPIEQALRDVGAILPVAIVERIARGAAASGRRRR